MKLAMQRTLATLTWLSLLASGVTGVAQQNSASQRGLSLLGGPGPAAQQQLAGTGQEGQAKVGYAPEAGPMLAPDQATRANGGYCQGCGGSEQGQDCGEAYAGQRCCAICGGGSCCPPLWSVDQGPQILLRSNSRYTLLGTQVLPNINSVAPDLSTKSINFNIAAGYDLTIDRYLGRDKAGRDDFLEFNFWGLNSWQDTQSVKGSRVFLPFLVNDNLVQTGNLLSGFATLFPATFPVIDNLYVQTIGGFNRADFQSISYQSDIYNFEVDLRLRPRGRPDRLVLHSNGQWLRECQPGRYFSYIFGLHYLMLNESFKFHSAGQINTVDPATGALLSAQNVTGDYNSYTHNNLLALIAGIDMTYRRCRAEWGVRAKVGPAVNFADQHSDVVTNAFGDPLVTTELDQHLKAKANNLAFLGGVSIFGSYRLQPDLIARASYGMLWVNGLALAPEQITFVLNPPPTVNTNGMVLYQGLSLTLEKTW